MTLPRKVVFVVEDDPGIRRLLRVYLQRMSLEVEEAATGRAALSLLERHEPSLVCLDLILPELSGYEICEKIRASPRLREVPVLVVSARATAPERAFAEEVGASAFLPKPVRWNAFKTMVSTLLKGGGSDQN
jgi:two-component system chemotaxis response regulator CheY